MRGCPTVLALSLSLVFGGDLRAQEAVTPDLEQELRMMVAEPSSADQDRAVVLGFLDRVDVRDAVDASGFDTERLAARVATLEHEELADLAAHVRDFEQEEDLVGGNTIVISGSTLIIILLVLIIVT